MDVNAIIAAVVIIGAIGLLIGLFLGIAALKLHIKTDPKEEAVLAELPGNNCGGCGFSGCEGYAKAVAAGEAAAKQTECKNKLRVMGNVDLDAVNMGYVSITPMTWSRTDMSIFEKLK